MTGTLTLLGAGPESGTAAEDGIPGAPGAPSFTKERLGGYVGAVSDVALVGTYETFLGHSLSHVTTYPGSASWAAITSSSLYDYWSTGAGAAYRDKMEWAVRMLPGDGSTLAQGAAGTFDSNWQTFANTLRDAGYGDAGTVIVRLGWEFSGSWTGEEYISDAGHAADYVTYWQRIVGIVRTTMAAASKPGVRFCWSPARDQVDPTPAWPGDSYVDIVGLSFYDTLNTAAAETRWTGYLAETYGLGWHAAYKPTIPHSLSEWGLDTTKTLTNGAIGSLPTTPITVDSTSGFPSSGGTIIIEVSGSPQTVTYTGTTGTTFTGCSGGTGAVPDNTGVRVGASLHDQPEWVQHVFGHVLDNGYEYALYFDKDNPTDYHQLRDDTTTVYPFARQRYLSLFSGQAGSASAGVALTGNHNSSDLASYATASYTPLANRLILASVHTRSKNSVDAPTPSLSGNGLTWVLVSTNLYDQAGAAHERLDVFRAMGSSPTAGALTIDYGDATNMDVCQWNIDQLADTDTGGSNGSAAVVQAATNKATSGTTGSATLSAFGNSKNATYLVVVRQALEATSPEAGYLPVNGQTNAIPMAIATMWLPANDTSPSATWVTSGAWGVTALEIKPK